MLLRCGLGIAISVAAGALVWGGCDDTSDVPADLLEAQQNPPDAPPPPATTRPTTQELVESKRGWMVLDALPLRMQVPPHWKIARQGAAGSIVWLEGPAPHSDVNIQLKEQVPMPATHVETLLRAARRGAEVEGLTVSVRDVDAAHIVHRRGAGRAMVVPVTDDQGLQLVDASGQLVSKTIVPMRWRVNVLVRGPQPDEYRNYELNFINLTYESYEQDKAFLEQILDTLQFTGPVSGDAPSTQPTTAPGAGGGMMR